MRSPWRPLTWRRRLAWGRPGWALPGRLAAKSRGPGVGGSEESEEQLGSQGANARAATSLATRAGSRRRRGAQGPRVRALRSRSQPPTPGRGDRRAAARSRFPVTTWPVTRERVQHLRLLPTGPLSSGRTETRGGVPPKVKLASSPPRTLPPLTRGAWLGKASVDRALARIRRALRSTPGPGGSVWKGCPPERGAYTREGRLALLRGSPARRPR